MTEARHRGVETIRARVASANRRSRRVLEHNGFTCTGTIDPPPGSTAAFLGYRISLRP